MGVFTQTDKLTTLKEAAAMVNDGDMVAIGGGLCLREPIGLIMEMIRQGKRDLHLVGTAHGFDVDLCCGGGIAGAVEETHVSFEQDFGLALNYRRACESGEVKVRESCCNTLINQLRAGSFGIPFIPLRSVKGSDELFMHPEYKVINDPFTGKKIVLAPALTPEVAIIHVDVADPRGNLKVLPPYVADVLFLRAANKVIVTAEKVVSEEEMKKIGPNVPYYETTAVVELPYGAHPTSCYPHYVYDREYISNYMKASREGPEAFKEKYLDKYVYGVKSHEEYVKLIGEERFARLASWKESKERWMELFTYE
jgi:glutaconate CoA-transferase subunit A